MKIIWLIGFASIVLCAVAFFAGQLGLLAGKPPKDLGVTEGRLKPPSTTPNSVSSQASLYPDHPQRGYADIAPFTFTGDPVTAMHKLRAVVGETPATTIVTATETYLYAQSRTPVLKFTDDVEFFLDNAAHLIHVRSASRLGRQDFATNRLRVENIRARFQQN